MRTGVSSIIVLAFILAGCASINDPVAAPPLAEGSSLGFNPPVETFDLCPVVTCGFSYPSFEPSVAVGQGGILAATAQVALARSTDGGQTFMRIVQPKMTVDLVLGDYWLPWDAFVQTGPDGAIWLSMMEVKGPGSPEQEVSALRIYRTPDAGLTWDLDVRVTVPWASTEEPDRQWLAFSPGTVLLVFQSFEHEPGGHSMRSHDGGHTWDGPYPISSDAQTGMPVWANDRFVVPSIRPDGVWVAVSGDGMEWQEYRVARTDAKYYLPTVAFEPEGRLWLAWRDGWDTDEQKVLVSQSTDGGLTWTAPQLISNPNETVMASPWAVASDQGVYFAYFSAADRAALATLNVVHVHDGIIDRGIVATGIDSRGPFTDFAHLALDGTRILVPYPDGQGSAFLVTSQ